MSFLKKGKRFGLSFAAAVLLSSCGGSSAPLDAPASLPQRALARTLNAPPTPDPTTLMDWAETKYAAFFPSHQSNISLPPFVYRFYPDSGNYLGVAGDQVYVMGPVAGGELLNVGPVQRFACFIYPRYCGALSNDYLPRLRGSQLLDTLQWKDTNSLQWQKLPTMLGTGANVVRLMLEPYNSDTGEPLLPTEPLAVRIAAAIENYGDLIEYLLANDVHVVLALNTYLSYPASHTWPDDGRSLWTSASAQQEVVDTWISLATRYKGRPGLLFDVMNEPHGVSDAEAFDSHKLARQQWNKLNAQVVSAVRQIDSQRWLLVEPIWGDSENLQFLDMSVTDARVAYSIHYYNPHDFTHQGVGSWPGGITYPGTAKDKDYLPAKVWNKQVLQTQLQVAKSFADAHNVRMVLGEAGVERRAPDDSRLRWGTDVAEIAESFGFDVIWFRWEGWGFSAAGWSWEGSNLEPMLSGLFSLNLNPEKR